MADNIEVKDKEETSTGSVTENLAADNEIRETTGSSVEIYDEDDDIELPANKKKKFKKRYVVIPLVVILIVVFFATRLSAAKNAVLIVETMDISLGDIENIISVSGTVESAESKSYFSDITAPIDTLNVKVGDRVSEGDILYTYDADSLDLAEKNAELTITQAQGSYNALYSAANSADRQYAEGRSTVMGDLELEDIFKRIDFALYEKISHIHVKISE